MQRKSTSMVDWSELQYDLLVLIGKRLNLIEDYLNFSSVCKPWRCAAKKDNFNSDLPRVPWLMLAEEQDEEGNSCRQFFSLYNGMILKKTIPESRGKRCLECLGWFITVGKEGEINLLHPFSGVQIELPHQSNFENYEEAIPLFDKRAYIAKAVLSASPSYKSDYVLMVIEGALKISIWRPGDLSWTRIQRGGLHHDVVYFNGQFYAIDRHGCVVVVYNVADPEPSETPLVAQLPSAGMMVWHYIVESLGSLFVIVRHFEVKHDLPLNRDYLTPLTCIIYHHVGDDLINNTDIFCDKPDVTTTFQVFKLDIDAGTLIQIQDLGDRALFLGSNASLSVQASQFPGIKPNHIYFTDNDNASPVYNEGDGLDMGVFDVGDGSIKAHYEGVSVSLVCPPAWVTPTLY
ncbi:F-box protein At2g26160-like [Lycium barbarum]|uniref:F-box protein At2g26160-like n=1 Tax=Lycium barbarum TaxID=112863 RepID=UPI00293F6BB5|nr:F-box protein At2g26160-like [Lycium barbarum]